MADSELPAILAHSQIELRRYMRLFQLDRRPFDQLFGAELLAHPAILAATPAVKGDAGHIVYKIQGDRSPVRHRHLACSIYSTITRGAGSHILVIVHDYIK